MPHIKITQAFVDGLPCHDSTKWFHDTDLAGFNKSVGRRSKTFQIGAEHQGRFMRVKIGRADVTKANEARAVARDILHPEIRRGVDPRALYHDEAGRANLGHPRLVAAGEGQCPSGSPVVHRSVRWPLACLSSHDDVLIGAQAVGMCQDHPRCEMGLS